MLRAYFSWSVSKHCKYMCSLSTTYLSTQVVAGGDLQGDVGALNTVTIKLQSWPLAPTTPLGQGLPFLAFFIFGTPSTQSLQPVLSPSLCTSLGNRSPVCCSGWS